MFIRVRSNKRKQKLNKLKRDPILGSNPKKQQRKSNLRNTYSLSIHYRIECKVNMSLTLD